MRTAILFLCLLSCNVLGAVTWITNTVGPSKTYSKLSDWEAGRNSNLTLGDGTNEVAECYTMNDTTAVTVDGWTTASGKGILIYTPTTQRHDGKWKTSAYVMTATLQLNEDFVTVHGLQISNTVASGNGAAFKIWSVINADSDIRIGYCIFRGNISGTGQGFGYFNYDSDAVVKIYNCIAYDFINGTVGCEAFDLRSNEKLWNTTVSNCYKGFVRVAGSPCSTNCISQGGTDGYISMNGDYNVSDIASDPPGANSRVGAVTFVGAYDFHLSASDTVARGYGLDVSGGGIFSDDIDGVTRSGTWDIGADQYVAAGGSSKPPNTYLLKGLLR